jgi:Zn-dependent peptidase ImmA (M78 family)
MILQECEIARAFKKVQAVKDYVNLYNVGGCHSLSVDTLTAAISDMYDLKIDMWEVAAPGILCAGNVERYGDGRCVIMVKVQQSEDMKRFVAVKELCHLMIDEEDDWSTLATDTLRGLKTEADLSKAGGDGVENPSRAQSSEFLALIAATALLYPCEFHAGDRAKLDADETTLAKIALHHEIPPYAVENAHLHAHIFDKFDDFVAMI